MTTNIDNNIDEEKEVKPNENYHFMNSDDPSMLEILFSAGLSSEKKHKKSSKENKYKNY